MAPHHLFKASRCPVISLSRRQCWASWLESRQCWPSGRSSLWALFEDTERKWRGSVPSNFWFKKLTTCKKCSSSSTTQDKSFCHCSRHHLHQADLPFCLLYGLSRPITLETDWSVFQVALNSQRFDDSGIPALASLPTFKCPAFLPRLACACSVKRWLC